MGSKFHKPSFELGKLALPLRKEILRTRKKLDSSFSLFRSA